MTADRYPSVPERITWTTGFRVATDKDVLGFLSTFADFKTGRGARMSLAALIGRAHMNRRRILRSLKRLEADGWIVARRRHRRPTTYDLCVDRLATNWVGAKVFLDLSDTSVTQQPVQIFSLSDTGDRLGDTAVTQDPVLSDTSVTPSPVRTIPSTDPQALRADFPDPATGPTDQTEAKADTPHQLTLGPYDVSVDQRRANIQRVADMIRAGMHAVSSDQEKQGTDG